MGLLHAYHLLQETLVENIVDCSVSWDSNNASVRFPEYGNLNKNIFMTKKIKLP